VEDKNMKIRTPIRMLLPLIALSMLAGYNSIMDDQGISMPRAVLDPSDRGKIQLSSAPLESYSLRSGAGDSQEVAAFFDEYFAGNLSRFHVPGATVAVVKDGEIIFSNGYGYADIEKQIPYDPDETVFWAASIAKIFSVVGVLQLYEQGLIHLDDDVNQYLDRFQIPEDDHPPITFRHLLTHTDGFEARIIGDAAKTPAGLRPLHTVVQDNLPERVAPPGEFLTYGNYGTNLAGVLVEGISGTPFNTYIDENIFQPLDMHRTTFEQVLPSEWISDLAVGYGYNDGVYDPKPFVYVNSLPQGGGRSTGIDMAHLMIALLGGGRYGNEPILGEDSIQLMFQQQFTSHPSLGGITCGLFEVFRNGQRLLIRDGDGWGFRSRMVLIPDQSMGFFVNYNNEDADTLREDLVSKFLDHYYPVNEQDPPTSPADFQNQADQFAGIYRPLQADETTFFKIALLFAQQIQVTNDLDGILQVTPVGMGDNYGGFEGTSRWAETEPLFFQRIDGEGYLAFGRDDRGRIAYLFSGQKYHGTYRKIAWYETPGLHFFLLIVSALLFIGTLIAWSIEAWIKRRRGASEVSTLLGRARWLAGIICALHLAFIVCITVVMGNFVEVIYGVPTLLRVSLVLPLLAVMLTVGQLVCTVLAWKDRTWSNWGRAYYTVLTLITLAFTWWLYHWNLLGFHY
jgi:CubicO group peptidase (beta-lactamase class C family)